MDNTLAPKPTTTAVATGSATRALVATRVVSPRGQALRRFRRHRLAVAGVVVFGLFCLMALAAPVVTRTDPDTVDLRARNQGPSLAHLFGTDRTGRDTFARTVYAGRVSLVIGLASAAISITIGGFAGAVAGYFGGAWDTVISRLTDIVMTFPAIIITLTVVALTGPGLEKIILIIGLLNWPVPCRLVRSKLLTLREAEFVQAARAIGAPPWRVILLHAFPNTVDVLAVYASFGVANAILLEAGLSFLGLGVQPPTASWGNLLNVARNVSVLESQPWLWAPAGAAIVLTVLAINFIGDGLRDALDPRMNIA